MYIPPEIRELIITFTEPPLAHIKVQYDILMRTCDYCCWLDEGQPAHGPRWFWETPQRDDPIMKLSWVYFMGFVRIG